MQIVGFLMRRLKCQVIEPSSMLSCSLFFSLTTPHPMAMNLIQVGYTVLEHVHEKTNNLGFRPGPTQTRLFSDSMKLEA